MRQRSSSGPARLQRALVLATLAGLLPAQGASGQQARLSVDPTRSLAWWQINPHLNHLWASTCPQDPSWRPGEGVSAAQAASGLRLAHHRMRYAAIIDTIVPLYPRKNVRPVCERGVEGQISVEDRASLRGVRGVVVVRGESLVTGLRLRDVLAAAILDVERYPEIRFRIDSLVAVEPGDTTRARAVGAFILHGVEQPIAVPLRAWSDAGGLRVVARFDMPAIEMSEVYGLSKWKIGMGITSGIWQVLHWGVDVVLRDDSAGPPP